MRACVESIIRFTDISQAEIILVANGAPEETRQLASEFHLKLLWSNEAIGYTRACNEGMKVATGDYVIPFNDDCVVLGPEWINMMLAPFDDPQMGITGPLMLHCPDAQRDFLVGFCFMVKREVLTAANYYDETFSPGYGEDCDLCCKAVDAGWKIVQVPVGEQNHLMDKGAESDLPDWKKDRMWVSSFPLYHDGNQTFGKDPEAFDVILRRNRVVLQERYRKVNTPTDTCGCGLPTFDGVCIECLKKEGIDIYEAAATDGWFGVDECAQLARWVKALPPNSVVCEVGSWHGRSSRAIAANLSEGSRLFCIDTFHGSSGEPEMHGTAHLDRGDHAFQWWLCNLWKYVDSGQVIPIRCDSVNAAHTLNHLGLKVDLLFVDADHSLEGFKTDIGKWAPLMKEGALWCGHDYYPEGKEPFAWIGVRAGVQELFPDAEKTATSLWYSRSKPKSRRTVIDAIPFNDELLLLETRFAELDSVVDRFVVVEATRSHSGNPKPLHFADNLDRFQPWLNKVTHIVVDDFPIEGLSGPDLHWAIERHQRDSIMRALTECKDDDIIIISDTDEIPRASAVASYEPSKGLCCLEMKLYYGSMNCEGVEPWRWTRMLTYGQLKEIKPCGARYIPNYEEHQVIKQAGWHFSFMGGPDEWVKKLEDTPHQEYNKPEFKDKAIMLERVRNGMDMLGRDIPYRIVEIDESYPKFVLDNIGRFERSQFVMHPEAYSYVAKVKEEFPDFFKNKKVLEVGSLIINGTVRDFFQDCDYTGIDLSAGHGVDQIANVNDFIPANYDVVISTEMFEHDKDWQKSLLTMYNKVKPGGMLLVTCAGPTRPEHGTTRTDSYSSPFTTNYYGNISRDDFLGVLGTKMFDECEIGYQRGQEDLVFFGIKPAEQTRETITACISTKDRYFTTLPLAISAIAQQTHKVDTLVVYDDGEQLDLREISPYNNLLKMLDELKVEWKIVATPRQGQVGNHQHCLETAETDLIWRIDDDEIPMPDCLEKLLECMAEDVGAVGGLVHHPGAVDAPPDFLDGSLDDVKANLNLSWFAWNGGPREVAQLYSTFVYRREAGKKAGGYPKGLSQIGHREETIFSHSIQRAGYRLLLQPLAKTFHLRENSGGIRSFTDHSMWEADEKIFQSYLQEWGANGGKPTKTIVLDCGIGDHFAFKSILPELRRRHLDKELILAVCFPKVFEGDNLKLISIADAKTMLGARYDDSNLYKWMWTNRWTKLLHEAMLEFWG